MPNRSHHNKNVQNRRDRGDREEKERKARAEQERREREGREERARALVVVARARLEELRRRGMNAQTPYRAG